MGSKDHGRRLRVTEFNPKGLPYDRGTITSAGGGSIILNDRCEWCEARRTLDPKRRLAKMLELGIDALNMVLEKVPQRPNHCCIYHWSHFMKLRTEEGERKLRALITGQGND